MDVGTEVRTLLCFMLATVILTVTLVVPLPFNEVSYIQDPTLHLGIRQAIYWGSGIAGFLFLIWKTGTDNMGGSFIAIIFGPLMFLFILFYWMSLRIFPRKIVQKETV